MDCDLNITICILNNQFWLNEKIGSKTNKQHHSFSPSRTITQRERERERERERMALILWTISPPHPQLLSWHDGIKKSLFVFAISQSIHPVGRCDPLLSSFSFPISVSPSLSYRPQFNMNQNNVAYHFPSPCSTTTTTTKTNTPILINTHPQLYPNKTLHTLLNSCIYTPHSYRSTHTLMSFFPHPYIYCTETQFTHAPIPYSQIIPIPKVFSPTVPPLFWVSSLFCYFDWINQALYYSTSPLMVNCVRKYP